MVSDRLQQTARSLAESRADLLSALVRCRSLLGQEGGAQRLIAERLADLGLAVEVWEPNVDELRRHPAFCAYPGFDELGYRDRPIVVARLPGTGGGRSLILQGHMDVVSAEPHAAWSHDPWGGERLDGRVYGRSSADMKGGLVAAFSALETLVVAGVRPRGDLLFQSVIDEEAYGNGALACAQRGYAADAAIIGEPTGLRVVAAHAGVSHFRITVNGRSAHPAHKARGVCAIEKAMLVYRALMDLEADRRARLSHPLFPNGSPVEIVVGTMHAGSWRSTVAGQAVLEARVGFAPGETIEQVQADIKLEQRATMFANVNNGDHNLALRFWYGSDPDILRLHFHSADLGGWNWSKYKNPQLDSLLEKGARTLDETERKATYAQIQQLVMKDALIVPVFDHKYVTATRSEVKDVKYDVRTYSWLYDAYVQK